MWYFICYVVGVLTGLFLSYICADTIIKQINKEK